MLRTYHKEDTKGQEFVIRGFGDCTYYTVCESKEEYDKEQSRLKKIDSDYKQKRQDYIDYLESLED